MKKTTISCVMALLCLNFSLYAQEPKPLQLGQKIHEAIYKQKFPVLGSQPGGADSVSLSQFQGKLLLLDFWAAWCSNCIHKFPLLEELQQAYPDQFKVLLVNAKTSKDSPERMLGILSGEKAPFIKTNLQSIYNDQLLDKLFPHAYLPHYVWIGGKGQVLAISGADLLNKETVEGLIKTTIQKNQKAQAELPKKP